jgi:hypothetical protein
VKSWFSRRAQIASNANDCVWRKFSIDALSVRNARILPAALARVHDFETITTPVPETPHSPCGQNELPEPVDFPVEQGRSQGGPLSLSVRLSSL